MEVMITGKQLDVTPALKEYVETRAKKIEKYTTNVTKAIFTLKVEKYRHMAEVLVKVNGFIIQSEQETDEMYVSVDKAISKIERQLKKHKEKLQNHRVQHDVTGQKTTPVPSWEDLNIKKRKAFPIDAMSIEEAALQMELLGTGFFLFENGESKQVNLLYKRKDGGLGLIERAA